MCPSTARVRDPAELLPKVAYELGVPALNLVLVFVFKRCILNSNTVRYFGHTTILYTLNMCLSRFLCYARHSDRNMQSLSEVCRRQQGARNVAFLYGICPKGRTRGLWVAEAWERKSAPSTDGGGGMQPAPERHSWVLGLMTWQSDYFVGRVSSRATQCMYCLVMRE
jgi:hypothetical protein